MKERQIPVLDEQAFKQMLERDPEALHRQPCIVTEYIERWPGYRDWQKIDYLRMRFSGLRAFAKAPNFITNIKTRLVSVETTFGQYMDYIEQPARVEEIYRDSWLEGDYTAFMEKKMPLYCGTLRFVHAADDPIFSELMPLVPEPMRPLNHALPYYYSLFNHLWLLVSLPGALTPLHTDNNGTIALVSQLVGRKRATLYSPQDLVHVHHPQIGFMDPLAPDVLDFPTHSQAVRWVADLTPGMTLFIGSNWAHHVTTLEKSISVSFDVVDKTNIIKYAISEAWAKVFGDRIKRQSATALKLGMDPDALPATDAVEVGRRAMAAVLRASLAGSAADAGKHEARRLYLEAIPMSAYVSQALV